MIRKRESKFEMLRILSMLMIILHHIALYTNMIDSQKLYVQALGEFIVIGGKIGCFLFVLLTGYFAKSSIKKNLYLGIKCGLSAAFYGCTFAILYSIKHDVGGKDIIKSCIPILGGGTGLSQRI